MTVYRSRILWVGPGRLIENAAIAVMGNTIAAVGSYQDVRHHGGGVNPPHTIDLGEHILLPGLINAHCHLDYSLCRGLIAPQNTFAAWIERINGFKRTLSAVDWTKSMEVGIEESRRFGTTTILNMAAYPHLLHTLGDVPLRIWWFAEMIDLIERHDPLEESAFIENLFANRPSWQGGVGLAPHAPYTASRALYLACDALGNRPDHPLPVSTHAAETSEETHLFRQAQGPLHDFLARLGRPMTDCGAGSPFFHLLLEGRLHAPWIIAHGNEPEPGVPEAMANSGWSVVHCPGTHRYFNRPPFPLSRYQDAGVNVCVGTDSLASNASLSLLAELRTLQRTHPELPPGRLLATITTNGARALRMENRLGTLAPGAAADAVAIPFSGRIQDAEHHVISWEAPVAWTLFDGRCTT